MKRRTVLAGLLIVALAALVTVLVRSGSGGGGEGTEITKGEPFEGKSPVTRSVAWIKAQQRHLNRHPQIERRLERQAGTAEAAREEAAGEAAGEEGEPTGEGESEAGERPLAAASGDAPVETDIREKPEPGEETGPPRQDGTPAPQARIGRSAIGPRSSLSEGTSFLGADSNDSGFIPPDSMGAVGPSQILVFVNGRIRLFDKQGTPDPNLDVSDLAFWAPVRNNRQVTDPGVEYDRISERWIISGINIQSTNNRVMIAVSDGPTLTDQTSFDYFFFTQSQPLPPGQQTPTRFADYPQLAVDNNAIYVGVNEFTSSTGTFAGTTTYVIRKSSVIGPMPSIFVTGFRTVANAIAQGPESPQPATTADPNVGEGYIVGPDNQISNRMDVRRITDPGGTPGISGNLVVPIAPTAQPLPVPALGTTGGLDALDDRFFEAMIARGPGGTDSLWTAHNIRVNSSGMGSASGDRDAARWYQLGDLGSDPPTLVQSGTLFDTAASNPRYFWMPSIAMNGQGHASLNTSTAGNGRRAEVAGSGRLADDPLFTTEAFDLIQSSNSGYNLGPDAPRRWGDFSQTVVDPTDDQTFWTFQEYTSAQNVWGVRVIQLKAPAPAVPAEASPNSVPIDPSPQHVTVNGIPVQRSGFFDTTDPPVGPPYNHLDVTVTNGDDTVSVVPGSIQVDDPTTLEFNLDTSAATPGFASITITNPDGQSATCSHALIVGNDSTPAATPSPQATSPPSPSNNNSPTVFGSGADCGSEVSIYANDPTCTDPPLVTGSATAFASPGIPVSVTDNTSTDFYAKATSVANVPSACSTTSATYVEDSIPPQVSVNSGPTGTIAEQTPTFTFSGSDTVGPVTFRCSLDTGAASFRACSGPGNSDTPTSPLADGSYTFRVRASDAAGNSSVATRSFSVLVPQPPPPPSAPETTINKGPKKTRKPRPKFRFSSSDASATFECRLDKGQFAACTSPFRTPKLRSGKHKLQVQAVGAGGTDATPAVKKFRVLPPK